MIWFFLLLIMPPEELAAALVSPNDSDVGTQKAASESVASTPFLDGHAGFADSSSQKLCGVVARANAETQLDKEDEEEEEQKVVAAATNPTDVFSWPQIDEMIAEWSSDGVDPSRANVEKMIHMLNLAFNKFVNGGLVSTPNLENVPTVAQCMQQDSQAPAANTGTEPTKHEDPLLNEMSTALHAEKFDLKSKIGDRWYAEIKINKDLREGYGNCGKRFAAQRAYRLDWLKGEYQLECKARIHETTVSQSEEVWGRYQPVTVCVRDEGNDVFAVVAVAKMLKNHLKMASSGVSLAGKRPFLAYSDATERYEPLYIQKGFRDLLTES